MGAGRTGNLTNESVYANMLSRSYIVRNAACVALPEGVAKMIGHEAATSPDRRLAYLPLYGDSGVGRPGNDGSDGAVAYVSCFGGPEVAVIDLASWQVTGMIEVGQKADGMAWAGH
jgi:hypothetical protein